MYHTLAKSLNARRRRRRRPEAFPKPPSQASSNSGFFPSMAFSENAQPYTRNLTLSPRFLNNKPLVVGPALSDCKVQGGPPTKHTLSRPNGLRFSSLNELRSGPKRTDMTATLKAQQLGPHNSSPSSSTTSQSSTARRRKLPTQSVPVIARRCLTYCSHSGNNTSRSIARRVGRCITGRSLKAGYIIVRPQLLPPQTLGKSPQVIQV